MTKITDLDALDALDGADLVAAVDDVGGTPITKKITVLEALEVVDTLTELTDVPEDTDTLLVLDSGVPKKLQVGNFSASVAASDTWHEVDAVDEPAFQNSWENYGVSGLAIAQSRELRCHQRPLLCRKGIDQTGA